MNDLQAVGFVHVGHVLQEVVVEEEGYAQQKLQIDGVLAESVIEAGALHAELPGEF